MDKLITIVFEVDPNVKISKQYPACLAYKFARWRNLKVWKTDLRDVTFRLDKSAIAESTGLADSNSIRVVAGTNYADGISTLLHEMVHSATMRKGVSEDHGVEFMRLFLEVAQCLLRRKIIVEGHTYRDVHRAIAHAFAEKYNVPKPRL